MNKPRRKTTKSTVHAPQGRLHRKVMELLDRTDLSMGCIAVECNLNYHWVVSLRRGGTKEPGVNRMEVLYEYLSGKKLKV